MQRIQKEVIKLENITKGKDGYFRFVSHWNNLATIGFKYKEGLIRWSKLIRFDSNTIQLMNTRYKVIYDID